MSNSQYKEPKMPLKERLTAIDAMRGLVMILMALDHASHAFNAGRYVTDSAGWYVPGSEIPAAQFMIRWVTHLCAPTFLFLAGFVLALSVARRQTHGESDRTLDGFLIKRGIFIILLDPFWMSRGFGAGIIFRCFTPLVGVFAVWFFYEGLAIGVCLQLAWRFSCSVHYLLHWPFGLEVGNHPVYSEHFLSRADAPLKEYMSFTPCCHG
jgi:hypothetical protein